MNKNKLFKKDFTLVVVGQIISLFGNAILRFALPLYILKQTGSPSLFGYVTALSFLPMILLSFIGGILSDRVNKRNIMVLLDFATSIIITITLLLLNQVSIAPLFIIVLMLLYGISGTYQPTVQASIPSLVDKEQVLAAGAVVNQIGSLASLIGPIVGGFLFGAFGIAPILFISVICFFTSAIMEIFITIPYTKRNFEQGIIQIVKTDFKDSINYIYKDNPVLFQIIMLVALFNLIISPLLMIGLPIIIVKTLSLSDELLGINQGLFALGGIFGGLLTLLLKTKLKHNKAYILLLLCSVLIAALGLSLIISMPSIMCYVILTVISFLIMSLSSIFSIEMLSFVQITTPNAILGKVIALMMSIIMISQPIGHSIYGFLFERFSTHIGYIALIVAITSSFIFLKSKKVFSRL